MKVVMFDKDGTLMDFASLWLECTEWLLRDVQRRERTVTNDERDDLLHRLGIEAGRIVPEGIIASGTSQQIAAVFAQFFLVDERAMYEWVVQQVESYTEQLKAKMKMTGDYIAVLQQLRRDGYVTGVVTADDEAGAKLFLQRFQLMPYFDFIIAGDNFPVAKPDRAIIEHVMRTYNVRAEEIVMVGDTPTDMQFGQHVGFTVGVLCGTGREEDLVGASCFIPSPAQLWQDGWIWQRA